MSLLNKNWKILCEDNSLSFIEKLFANRGILTKKEQEDFLGEKFDFYDPFLLKDMDKAVERITRAIKNNEKIVICGDYDVDGISGSAILIQTLRKLNANVSYRLPHRMKDGYGLQEKFIHEFKDLGVHLIITVDNGVACKDQIDLAKSFGIDTIVTDHHTIPAQFPDSAYAVVHPKQEGCNYPFKDLAGAGVAFKVSKALIRSFDIEDGADFIEALYDLASLGTVADCTSLTSENRFIVKKGLERMQNTRWRGLDLLMKSAGIDVISPNDAHIIGFRIGPRINAAGRMGSPYFALQALLDEGGKGEMLVNELEKLNGERQKASEKAMNELETGLDKFLHDNICIAEHSDWSIGIVGLLAGRISEKYGKPAFIMEDKGDTLVGSARCPDFFDVFEAISFAKEHLDHFGGHKQAAGFSLKKENLDAFRTALREFSLNYLKDRDMRSILKIDTEISAEDLSRENFYMLEKFAPFGVGNDRPTFLIKNAKVTNLKKFGSDKHIGFETSVGNKTFKSKAFNCGRFDNDLREGNYDIVCNFDINRWNGRENMELNVIDLTSV